MLLLEWQQNSLLVLWQLCSGVMILTGELQGGPMYVIEQGMGKKFKFLSYWFSAAGLIGCLSLLQVNQLTQILSDQVVN